MNPSKGPSTEESVRESMDGGTELGVRFRADPLAVLKDLPISPGGVSTFSLGSEIVHLLDDPELMFDVFVTRRQGFATALGFRHARTLLGPGVFSRRLAWPGARLRASFLPTVMREAERAWEARPPGPIADLFTEARHLCFKALVALIGGECHHSSPEGEAAISRILDTLNRYAPLLVDPEARLSQERADVFHDAVGALRAQVSSEESAPEFFELLATTLLAGYEQSASVLVWFWSFLATSPTSEARFHDEIDTTFGGRNANMDALRSLKFSRALLQETIRLCPPVWMLVLRAKADHPLGDGCVRAGEFVVASPYRTHRDERFHPRPEEFTPDRWLSERSSTPLPFTYFPFGHGPRACRGVSFVEDMLLALVVTLGRRWRVRLPEQPRMEAKITLRPRAPVIALLDRRVP